MTVNIQQSPYLPRQRNFPIDNTQALGIELDKTYIEIAQRVNERTIGLFSANLPSITGESWYLIGQPRKQQTLRQVYSFGSISPGSSLTIPIGNISVTNFTRIYGTALTNAPDYRPIPFSAQVVTNNITVSVSLVTGLITIQNGSTAPTINSGLIILEWLSSVATNT